MANDESNENKDSLEKGTDQGFNDQELCDIMAEIEDLEQDLEVSASDESLDESSSVEVTEAVASTAEVAENDPGNDNETQMEASAVIDEPENSLEEVEKEVTNLQSGNTDNMADGIDIEEEEINEEIIDEVMNEINDEALLSSESEEESEFSASAASEIIDNVDQETEIESQAEIKEAACVVSNESSEDNDDEIDNVAELSEHMPKKVENEENKTFVKGENRPFGFNFLGEGNYNFKMDFPVGDKSVHFEVHPDNTFELDFDQVKFSITGQYCIVEMEGGATFKLPLIQSKKDDLKKAS